MLKYFSLFIQKSKNKYDESKLVGIQGNHPLRLSIINLAIVNSTVKEPNEKDYIINDEINFELVTL